MAAETSLLAQVSPAGAAADEPDPQGYLDASERRLIARIQRGDERAFAQLVRAYQDRVFSLCVRMLGSREEAEEVVQEIFVAVHQNLGRFRAEARLSTWIYRVTRNRCLNRLKYLSRRSHGRTTDLESVSDAHLVELSGRAPLRPDQHLEGRQLQDALERGMAALPEEQRLLVLLRDVQGLSYDEISTVCEVPVGTVKSRLHRARLALASGLTERSDEAAGDAAPQEPGE